MPVLDRSFYASTDVVRLAKELLGKVIETRIDGVRTSGVITGTEAYAGEGDRASHAHGGRRTARTEVMYGAPGRAYVYLCYGIHHLFNVVTAPKGVPHAVLVRTMTPLEGKAVMRGRRGSGDRLRTVGPGMMAQALGITTALSGADLIRGPIRISDEGLRVDNEAVTISPRIGVAYAGDDALLPYRFDIPMSGIA